MQESAGASASTSVNPATGEQFAVWPLADAAHIERTLEAAHRAAPIWRSQSLAQRAALLRGAAAQLRQNKASLARSITLEMGKPLPESEAEVEKSAWNCEYVAEHGPGWLADDVVATQARSSYVAHLPLGVVLSILPWNFPVWQIFRCAASALMAGNTILMKHARTCRAAPIKWLSSWRPRERRLVCSRICTRPFRPLHRS
jgi:succinate-semialdehyde dehydrogenase/glutarate-semialdehyde dehydrogenase